MEERFNANDILKKIIDIEGFNQTDISKQVFGQSNRLSKAFADGTDMTVSNFSAVCDALGYDLVVVRREGRIPDHFTMTTEPRRRSNFKQ